MKTDSAKRILNHLNGVCPTIQFTFKFEKNSSLPFLDAHLTQSQHYNGIDMMVYRKPLTRSVPGLPLTLSYPHKKGSGEVPG